MPQTKQALDARNQPARIFSCLELFAGAGGLALGLEKAGFQAVALNEIDRDACTTLKINRPSWNIIQADIAKVNFSEFADIDLVSGGIPCQAFSYAGKKLGLEDIRGTLFFQFFRAIGEIKPKVFLGENVRGLLNHDKGKTLSVLKSIISNMGYTLVEPKVLKALFYRVPQKRERLFLVGIRNDLVELANFDWPPPHYKTFALKDALKSGELFNTDVPESQGQSYPERKKEILSWVPPGGYWRDLPDALQREYMQGCYFASGGQTSIARRLSWDEPSLTLLCSPAQKKTDRCHPEETRPLTIREYARIQTFPDEWQFSGSVCSQYRQIGNAVPVNLAHSLGLSIAALLNDIDQKTSFCPIRDRLDETKSKIMQKFAQTEQTGQKKKMTELISTRARILAKLGRYLQTILKKNGYLTDAGNRVGYFKEITHEDGERGAMTFRDVQENFEPDGRRYKSAMDVEIEVLQWTDKPMSAICNLTEDLTAAFTHRFTGQWPEGIIAVMPKRIKKTITPGESYSCIRALFCLKILYWLDVEVQPTSLIESQQNGKTKANNESTRQRAG
jgi:DNA (cytosine-5)-methyltransferase 1